MPNNQPAIETIDKIIGLLKDLKTQISVQNVVQAAMATAPTNADLDSFEGLKTLLYSKQWPEAVNPTFICDSEDDKVERGRAIIELMVDDNLKDLKFLDFGCGEGHCLALSSDYNTTLSMGYDPVEHSNWSKFVEKPNLKFTTDMSVVEESGPYDVILLFDVLDHVQDPTKLLTEVNKVLSPNGRVYMRTHPFVSKHGTHLYRTLNKAYIHLVFTPEELAQLLPSTPSDSGLGVTKPINTYQKFIEDAGLTIKSKKETTEKVDPFFKQPKIANRITQNSKLDFFPEFQMTLQFIDYKLTKASNSV